MSLNKAAPNSKYAIKTEINLRRRIIKKWDRWSDFDAKRVGRINPPIWIIKWIKSKPRQGCK